MARKPVQHSIEDKAFLGLIKRYFRLRDFVMVEALLSDYGRILFDRPGGADAHQASDA